MRPLFLAGISFVSLTPALGLAGDSWVTFVEETSTRLVADAAISTADPEEKDYAWGDFDHDGDDDLAIVRKQPFTTAGRKRNVLLMNEGGVLVDRTVEYATNADDGGQGFLDLTNDRDVIATDVNLDGWLDLVTAPACNSCGGLPKSITHPRVYLNLGESAGVWLGFQYQEARTPQFSAPPNFCGVAAGNLDDDPAPEIYFTDYNSSLEDRLLINDGNGFFTDDTAARMTPPMYESGFGTHATIVDMNGDGINDIQKGENGPAEVLYNGGSGMFTAFESVHNGASYFTQTGELNNDGRLDLIMSDDGQDVYRLNQGNGADGLADFIATSFTYADGQFDDGFASNSLAADLDNDGWNDVIIADVDVDAGGCGRITKIYRNLADAPNVTLQTQGTVGIGSSNLQGVHDFAVMDINSDGWLDLVIGQCNTTKVWINEPPFGMSIMYPNGLPNLIPIAEVSTLAVRMEPVGAATTLPSTATLHYSIAGGPFSTIPMTHLGGDDFEGALPAAGCLEDVNYFVSVEIAEGGTFTDPPNAPSETHLVIPTSGLHMTINDGMEGSTAGWTILIDHIDGGVWEPAEPIGTVNNGSLAAPGEDADPEPENVMAMVTENCAFEGCSAGSADVDGEATDLISPMINIAGSDAFVHYYRWFFSTGADVLEVAVTNDGDNWVPVESVGTTVGLSGQTEWLQHSFRVSDFVEPTSTVQVRFRASDPPDAASITEAGIDRFQVERLMCGACADDNCCDANDDGIRDDGCVWCECNDPCGGSSMEVDVVFADMGGQFGDCFPDGVADNNDRFIALNCFANVDTQGNSGAFPCEIDPPNALNVDAGGQFGDCNPDGVCDGNDAFHALNAFGNSSPCSCPLDGGPAPTVTTKPQIIDRTTVRLESASTRVAIGDIFEVKAYLTRPVSDLRGYQLHLGVSGGKSGTIEVLDIAIADDAAVYDGLGAWSAFNTMTAQMVAGLDTPGIVTRANAYLATFTLRASADAAGAFVIDLLYDDTRSDHRTFLFATPATGKIELTHVTPVIVDVTTTRTNAKRTR